MYDERGQLQLVSQETKRCPVDQLLTEEQYTGDTGPSVHATTAHPTAGGTLWPLTAHLGSVRGLVDNNCMIRQHVTYDSFGNRLIEQHYDTAGAPVAASHAEAVDTLFGYTGRDWDADTGLQYNRARWYDPSTGRWLSQDPIGFSAGDGNLYRYVENGVTGKADPSGLQEGDQGVPQSSAQPFAPRPNQLPTPGLATGWQNKNQLWPWQTAWISRKDVIFFERDQSVTNYVNSGFSKENALEAWTYGCFMLASHRIGLPGRHLALAQGVDRFTNLYSAWVHLESLIASGKKARLVLIQSTNPPTIPPGHDPSKPIPRYTDRPDPLAPMFSRYDYVTLHWDSSQQQYFWESQHDSCNSVDAKDNKLGQHWRASSPQSGLPHTVYLVVEITPDMDRNAQGLPNVPWIE